MNYINCRLIECNERSFLVFDDGRIAKIGDRVFNPVYCELDRVNSIFTDFEKEGLCSTDGHGNASFRLRSLSVVAATISEITKEDFKRLRESQNAYVIEENGLLIQDNEKIKVQFDI